MSVVPKAHGGRSRKEEEPVWKRVCVCGVFERGKEVKKKKSRRLATRLEHLSERIDDVWSETNGDRLFHCREALDRAIFELGRAQGELIKESTRKK